MTLSSFVSRLNWRLMVIHFIACWFFIYAFTMLSYLHDLETANFFLYMNVHKNAGNLKIPDVNRISYFSLWLALGELLGLLISFLISLTISIKKHWYWLNSVIVLLIAGILHRFDLLGWDYLKMIFLTPGSFFQPFSVPYLLINGLVMLAIGVLLLFSKKVIQFIDANRQMSADV